MWRSNASSDNGLLPPPLFGSEPVWFPQFKGLFISFAGTFGLALQISHGGLHVDERRDFIHVFSAVFFIRRRAVDELLDDVISASFSYARFEVGLMISGEIEFGA